MNKITLFFFIFISLLLNESSCDKQFDDTLSLSRTEYYGSKLKIDGYYFCGNESHFFETCFFYQNGIYVNWGGTPNNIENPFYFVENNYKSEKHINAIKHNKSGWGVFQIENNNIKIERWFCTDGICRAYVCEGIILNDTTFRITKTYRNDGTGLKMIDNLYCFKNFLPKPDSTNNFIK
jgi:hypothetical protein